MWMTTAFNAVRLPMFALTEPCCAVLSLAMVCCALRSLLRGATLTPLRLLTTLSLSMTILQRTSTQSTPA